MPFSFDEARKYGGSPPRTDEFTFEIQDFGLTIDRTKLLVNGVTITPFDFNTEEFKKSSNTLPYVNGINFGPIEVEFLEAPKYEVFKAIDEWKNGIYINEGNLKGVFEPRANYTKTGVLRAINDKQGNQEVLTVRMRGMVPAGPNEFNYEYSDDPDAINYMLNIEVEEIDWEFQLLD